MERGLRSGPRLCSCPPPPDRAAGAQASPRWPLAGRGRPRERLRCSARRVRPLPAGLLLGSLPCTPQLWRQQGLLHPPGTVLTAPVTALTPPLTPVLRQQLNSLLQQLQRQHQAVTLPLWHLPRPAQAQGLQQGLQQGLHPRRLPRRPALAGKCAAKGPPCWQAGLASHHVPASDSMQPVRPQLLLASMWLHSMGLKTLLLPPTTRTALMQLMAHSLRAQQLPTSPLVVVRNQQKGCRQALMAMQHPSVRCRLPLPRQLAMVRVARGRQSWLGGSGGSRLVKSPCHPSSSQASKTRSQRGCRTSLWRQVMLHRMLSASALRGSGASACPACCMPAAARCS